MDFKISAAKLIELITHSSRSFGSTFVFVLLASGPWHGAPKIPGPAQAIGRAFVTAKESLWVTLEFMQMRVTPKGADCQKDQMSRWSQNFWPHPLTYGEGEGLGAKRKKKYNPQKMLAQQDSEKCPDRRHLEVGGRGRSCSVLFPPSPCTSLPLAIPELSLLHHPGAVSGTGVTKPKKRAVRTLMDAGAEPRGAGVCHTLCSLSHGFALSSCHQTRISSQEKPGRARIWSKEREKAYLGC